MEMAVPCFYGPVGPHPFSRMKRARMVVLYVYSLSTRVVPTMLLYFQLNYMTSQSLPNPKIELLIVHMTQNLSEKKQ